MRALEIEGIRLAFGNPTPNDIALFDSLAGSDRIRPVLVAQEAHAARMAIGAWHAGRTLSCITLPGDAGITSAIPGLAEAGTSGVPMVALAIGATDDAMARLAPFCRGSQCPDTGTSLYHAIRNAAQAARQTGGPVALGLSTTLLEKINPDSDVESAGPAPAPVIPPAAVAPAGSAAPRRTGPESLLDRLAARLGPAARFVADGSGGARLQPQLALAADQWLGHPGTGRAGSAIPIAIGAKLARPDLPIVALADEDGFLASGTELLTALTAGAAVIVVVMRTRQRHGSDGLPRYDAGSLADAVGVEWIRLDRDGAVGDALDYLAFVTGQGRPMVLEMVDDAPAPDSPGSEAAPVSFRERIARLLGSIGRRIRS